MGMTKYTVVISRNNTLHKVCKVLFGSDGSYYVTVPYHSANKAILAKQTVNYTTSVPTGLDHEDFVPLSEAIDSGQSDEARVKLSHHPSGFVQFSGQGLVSGRNPDGTFKGIGVDSWPLAVGNPGPAFGITLFDVAEFEAVAVRPKDACVLDFDRLTLIPGATTVFVEGHYFTALWRRFIQTKGDGTKSIQIVHPNGVVMELLVLLPGDDCPLGGFIGVTMFGGLPGRSSAEAGYIVTGSTGNRRLNDRGETLGDAIFCVYPRPEWLTLPRSLDYQPPGGLAGPSTAGDAT